MTCRTNVRREGNNQPELSENKEYYAIRIEPYGQTKTEHFLDSLIGKVSEVANPRSFRGSDCVRKIAENKYHIQECTNIMSKDNRVEMLKESLVKAVKKFPNKSFEGLFTFY